MSIFAQLTRLEKVCEKVWSKEYCLIEQSLKEFKAKEQKEKNSVKAESLAVLVAY